MKKIFKILTFLLLSFNLSYAFAWTIDHFQVEFAKSSAWKFESLDIIIKAVDKNNDIVKDYTWNVIWISQTDDWVELPEELWSDEWYSFQLSDQWIKKFENWVKFSASWEQNISIYDTNDYENITGIWEIKIVEADSKTEAEIEILNPETNTTLPENKVIVSWATNKNHQVKIELNNTKNFNTTSNSDWIFEKEIEWLQPWENTLKAYVLDSDEKVIWESSKVIIKIDDNKPQFKKIVLSPISESGSVEEWTNIDVKVYATKWLKIVNLLFNDWVIKLSETETWVYTWNFKAPNKEETYSMDVVLNDTLWHTTTEKDVTSISVYLATNSASETATWVIIEECKDIDWKILKITWLKLVKLKTKSILTWDKIEKAISYDVYKKNNETWDFEFLQNIKESKLEIEITWDEIKFHDFAVKAKAEWCEEWTLVTWDLSNATNIQTGPTEIIIMLILSLILWFGYTAIKRQRS